MQYGLVYNDGSICHGPFDTLEHAQAKLEALGFQDYAKVVELDEPVTIKPVTR